MRERGAKFLGVAARVDGVDLVDVSVSRISGAPLGTISFRSASFGFSGFFLAISGRRIRLERMQQPGRDFCDLLDASKKGGFVRF